MVFKGDIIIMDPCNAVKNDEDWQLCKWGTDMSSLGFREYLYIDAGDEYGCKVINIDTDELIGKFCTDSCALVVLYFDELMRYNPDFTDHMEWPDSNTIIKQFDGTIVMDEENLAIVGTGNINFKTVED